MTIFLPFPGSSIRCFRRAFVDKIGERDKGKYAGLKKGDDKGSGNFRYRARSEG